MTTLAAAPGAAVKVGLGQVVACAEPQRVLSALGLGSCIGLVMVDPRTGAVGMAHVMLPDSTLSAAGGPRGKYADTAVPALIEALCRLGASEGRLVVKMAGGAQMFTGAPAARGAAGAGSLNIGTRNAVAVRAALSAAGLRLRAADTGGNAGRTLEVVAGTGLVTVRSVGGPRRAL